MRAIRLHQHGPSQDLRFEHVPDLQPGPDEVLIQVKVAGVNPVDTYIRAGSQGYSASFPWTPGLDGAGIVLATGDQVSAFTQGDRVYCAGSLTGTYAEQTLCPETRVYPLPDSATFQSGACLGVPYATAFRALIHRGEASQGERVLLHGATGSVGQAALQIGIHLGLKVIGTAGSTKGCNQLIALGAEAAFNHRDPEHWEQILRWSKGGGIDLILEMAAHQNLDRDLRLMAPGGRIVLIGNKGTVEINPRDAMQRDVDIRGMVLFNASLPDLKDIHSRIFRGLTEGWLAPHIEKQMPLSEASAAHQAIADGQTGKIILIP